MTIPSIGSMPPIGRNGIVNSVRKLSGNIVTGWRPVDLSASFIAGYVACLDSSGNLVVADSTSSRYISGKILGLFNCHKTTSFYRPISGELVTFTGAGSVVNLAHANLQASEYRVYNTSTGTAYSDSTDYTISTTNGTLTLAGGTTIGTTETVGVNYRYLDPNLSGIDQTLGSGCASVIEGNGEIATLCYEINVAWAINTAVTVSSNGLPTIGGSGQAIGFVTKVPTASNPELQFQMRLA